MLRFIRTRTSDSESKRLMKIKEPSEEHRILFLDESGDLGFRFYGFRARRSSSNLVIAFISVENPDGTYEIDRAFRKTREKFSIPGDVEIKASQSRDKVIDYLLRRLADHSDLEIAAIIVNKRKVKRGLREAPNILYNYASSLIIPGYVRRFNKVTLVCDERSKCVPFGQQINEYLKKKLEERDYDPNRIDIRHQDSKRSMGIQAADVVSNAIFRKYEYGDSTMYDLVRAKTINEFPLFFR